MPKLFQVASKIGGVKSMADGGWQLRIDTQELAPEQFAQVASLKEKYGWFLFAENNIDLKDIPTEQAPEFKEEKSPSKRLRDCLYVWWEKNTNKSKPFDTVWKEWCNKKCEEIKETL